MPRTGHIVLAVRLIKRTTLRHYAARFSKAGRPLEDWARLVLAGSWRNLVETRRMFPHADQAKVKSGKTVTIFNVSKDAAPWCASNGTEDVKRPTINATIPSVFAMNSSTPDIFMFSVVSVAIRINHVRVHLNGAR